MPSRTATTVEPISSARAVLADGAQVEVEVALLDLAGRAVQVLLAQQARDAVGGEAEGEHAVAVEVDLDLPPQAAADVDRGDAGHALEPALDALLGELAQLGRIQGLARRRRGRRWGRRRGRT